MNNMHDALALLFDALAALAAGLTFWLFADGLLRLEARRGYRHMRRLDQAKQRRIDKEFKRITGHTDGIERP